MKVWEIQPIRTILRIGHFRVKEGVETYSINLGRFDPTATPQYNDSTLSRNQYAAGDVIWNTTKSVLQVYTGNKWQDLSTRTEVGLEATGAAGILTVSTNGATTISL